MNIQEIAKEVEATEAAKTLLGDGVKGFEVSPAVMYPAMVTEVKAALKEGKGPAKFLDTEGTPNPLRMYYDDAKQIGSEAFDLALVPYDSATGLSADDKSKRNAALECARKWFTELLHQSIGGKPMGLRIAAEDKQYKLC
jgi:hypothetical protein